MPDDKSKQGAGDRDRVAAGEKYEVSYFAQKHDISAEQALELIEKHGNSREALDNAAEQMKASGKSAKDV